MTLTIRQQDEAMFLMDKHFEPRKVNSMVWRVKWRDNFIVTASGKSAWKREAHARSAFRSHLKRQYSLANEWNKIFSGNPNIPYDTSGALMDVFCMYVLGTGHVQFVQVSG